jgi:serine O-acetyltransferase
MTSDSIDANLGVTEAASKSSAANETFVAPELEPLPLSLWAMIREDWAAHGKDWTKPGFRAIAIHRFGVWRMFIQPKLLRAPFSILYRMLYRKARNTYGIEVPYTAKIGRRVVIEHQSGIVIHGGCTIGDDCIIRQGVTMGNRYVQQPFDAPQLGKRVNVGAGAKIFGNVHLGDDCNIGANAVVLCDVPDHGTAVGIPAKVRVNAPGAESFTASEPPASDPGK